jgi:hypothetical protein
MQADVATTAKGATHMAKIELTLNETIQTLEKWAIQIRRESKATLYPTADEDAALLEHAAELLERLKE